METVRQMNKPWALLFILLGVILFLMAWTSYTIILRIIVALGALVLVDYGLSLLGLPTPSQFISSFVGHFSHKKQ
jgi:hypothetical protein